MEGETVERFRFQNEEETPPEGIRTLPAECFPSNPASYLKSRGSSASSIASSYGSVGLQHLELKELAQGVLGPLKSGLQSFNIVSEMLLSANASSILPGCQSFHDIRQQIERMKQMLEKSQHVARTQLHLLDRETELLTVERSHLVNQKKLRESELEDLKMKLESHISSLKTCDDALETARRHLKLAEEIRNSMRERRETAEIVRNVGIGLMFIPIVGTIVGAFIVGAGIEEMNRATAAADEAVKVVENCESHVRSSSVKVSEHKSLIHKTERNIQEADNDIHEVEAKLQGMSVKRKVVADIQAKMRQAVHKLGLLCGVGSVLELQTRYMILLEPVVKIMEEMTATLGQITGDELHTEDMQSLLSFAQMNQNKLKQLAGKRCFSTSKVTYVKK